MQKPDYYELLGIERTVDVQEIKGAFRKKALEFHPDRNPGNKEAEEMFKLCSEAYEVLSDSNKRQVYDQFGHAGLAGGGSGFHGGFSSAEEIFSSFGDIFEDFFGFSGRSSRSSGSRRGQDLQTELTIEFLEACHGCEKKTEIYREKLCKTCEGSGASPGSQPEVCSSCGGHGQVQVRQGFFSIRTNCPQCQGQGKIIRKKCSACHGAGVEKEKKTLNVKIPPGVADGMRLLLQGEGMPGRGGAGHGDLYVFIRVLAHEEFKRDGNNILSEVKVHFSDLVLGRKLTINTIDGVTELDIPAGTPIEKILKIKGRGVQSIRGGKRGEHLVSLKLIVPDKVTERQKQLLQELSVELGESAASDHKKGKKQKKGFFS